MKLCHKCQKKKHPKQGFPTRSKVCHQCVGSERKKNATGPNKGKKYADMMMKLLDDER